MPQSVTENAHFQKHSDNLIKWLLNQQGTSISPKIQLVDLRNQKQGRGVIATSAIEKGEELFTLPYESTLTVDKSVFYQKAKAELDDLPYWTALVLVLIFELGQQDESKWQYYLQLLPDTLETLMYWSESELEELCGSSVLHKIGKHDAELIFETQLWPVAKTHRSDFRFLAQAFDGADGIEVFRKLCHRIASIIFAYGFDFDPDFDSDVEQEFSDDDDDAGKIMLVPLADMLNADADLNNAHLVQNKVSVTMTAIKPIAAGDQIFNDFGELPRSDLLRRYGYITERYKKYDVVELPLSLIIETISEVYGVPLRETSTSKILDDGYDLGRTDRSSGLPRLTLDLAQVFPLLLKDPRALEQLKSLKSDTLDIRAFNDITGCAPVLKTILRKRIAQYPTAIAQDRALLADRFLTSRKRAAVEVRLGEKEILAVWLHMIDTITNGLDGKCLLTSQQTKRKRTEGHLGSTKTTNLPLDLNTEE